MKIFFLLYNEDDLNCGKVKFLVVKTIKKVQVHKKIYFFSAAKQQDERLLKKNKNKNKQEHLGNMMRQKW